MKTYRYFNSLDEFVETANQTPQSYRKSSKTGSQSFTGCKSIESAIEITKNGFELDKLHTLLNGIKSVDKYEIESYYDIAGCEVEIGRMMAGEPECMLEFTMQEQHKFIHLIIGLSEACGIDSEQILNRAAAICSIVDHLENNNYRTKLSITFYNPQMKNSSSSRDIDTHFIMVNIKEYMEPLSINKLAGVMHTGTNRRIYFMYMEGHKDCSNVRCNYPN